MFLLYPNFVVTQAETKSLLQTNQKWNSQTNSKNIFCSAQSGLCWFPHVDLNSLAPFSCSWLFPQEFPERCCLLVSSFDHRKPIFHSVHHCALSSVTTGAFSCGQISLHLFKFWISRLIKIMFCKKFSQYFISLTPASDTVILILHS